MKNQDNTGDKAEECGPVHHWLDPRQMKCRCGLLTTIPFFTRTAYLASALPSPETPRDLLDECIPRVLELLRNAGITEPDELKHTLEDHARWFVNAHLSPPETLQEQLPSPYHSFDARFWAESFVAHVKQHPGIPTDVGTMVAWFASALMRGFDEARKSDPPPETPQEDAAPPVVDDLAVVIVERVVAGVRLGVPRSQTIRAVVEILKQQPPSLLAAPEGRVRALIAKWREEATSADERFASIDTPTAAARNRGLYVGLAGCADELEAALAPLDAQKETKG